VLCYRGKKNIELLFLLSVIQDLESESVFVSAEESLTNQNNNNDEVAACGGGGGGGDQSPAVIDPEDKGRTLLKVLTLFCSKCPEIVTDRSTSLLHVSMTGQLSGVCRYPAGALLSVRSVAGTPQVPRTAVRSGAEVGLLSLRLSVSQGVSLGDSRSAPTCSINNVTL